ncbi:MAG: hypothetical protein WBA00_01340 [Rhodococcus sp. (in: high G+C Gram-positive bacteria)]
MSTSIVRRVLVVSVVVVVTVCALLCQRPLVVFAAAGTVAATSMEMGSTAMEMGSTAAVPVGTTVVGTGVRTVTSENHASMDCGGFAGGAACVDAEAVLLLSAVTAPPLEVRTGVELEETGRYPTHGLPVPQESNRPPWTVLSLAQLSVSRV